MKYIRTKDGRIRIVVELNEFDEEERRKIPNDCTMVKSNNIFGCSIVKNENIIKQADTIEELCDEKVAIRKSNHKPYLGHFSGTFWFQEDSGWLGRVDSYENIYGAIWTDKGLVYVAKMKGVLPNGEIDWELL